MPIRKTGWCLVEIDNEIFIPQILDFKLTDNLITEACKPKINLRCPRQKIHVARSVRDSNFGRFQTHTFDTDRVHVGHLR